MRTVQSRIEIALACDHRLHARSVRSSFELSRDPAAPVAHIGETKTCTLEAGESVCLEKRVAITTSRDRATSECTHEALEWVAHLRKYDELISSHVLDWDYLWSRCDLVAALPRKDLLALRLHIFQLLQTASLDTVDADAGIPARGWHGEAYRGHLFWDELFVFPFLNFRMPELARALLLYRYRRFPAARRPAWTGGHCGTA